MVRHYGRSPYGERLSPVPHGHWKTLTLVAALRIDRTTAPYAIDGAMDGPSFLAYVEQVLAPTLHKGDIGPPLTPCGLGPFARVAMQHSRTAGRDISCFRLSHEVAECDGAELECNLGSHRKSIEFRTRIAELVGLTRLSMSP
jgi:hypothetical protein